MPSAVVLLVEVVSLSEVTARRVASSAQHHRGDGSASSLGPVGMGKEQRAVHGGGLVEVGELLSFSLSGVEEVNSGRICETTGVGE